MTISPAQLKVLKMMADGFELRKIYSFDLSIWLQQGNEIKRVTKQCLNALLQRGLIEFKSKTVGGYSIYVLTEAGHNIAINGIPKRRKYTKQ
jgi:hypothetical protein